MSSSLFGNTNYQITIIQEPNSNSVKGTNVSAYMPDKFMWDVSSNYAAPFAQGLLGSGLVSNVAAVFGYRMITPAMTAEVWQGSSSSELTLSLEFFAETNTYNDVTSKVIALMKLATPSVDATLGLITSPGPQLTIAGVKNIGIESVSTYSNIATRLGISKSVVDFVTAPVIKMINNIPTPEPVAMVDSNTQCTAASANADIASLNSKDRSIGQNAIWKSNLEGKISIKLGNYAFFDCVVVTKVQQVYSNILDSHGKPTHVVLELSFKPMFIITQDDLDSIFLNPSSTS